MFGSASIEVVMLRMYGWVAKVLVKLLYTSFVAVSFLSSVNQRAHDVICRNLVVTFGTLLQEAGNMCGGASPLVLFVDGLYLMDSTHQPCSLAWLPHPLPQVCVSVYVGLSVIDGLQAQSVQPGLAVISCARCVCPYLYGSLVTVCSVRSFVRHQRNPVQQSPLQTHKMGPLE